MHDGRMIQVWRKRLRIKQQDLAQLICIPTQTLQDLENSKRVPEAKFLHSMALNALKDFDKRPICDLAIEAMSLMHNTRGFIAGVQTMTRHDTDTDFYRAKIEQARARVRIVDQLKFVKGPLPGESLFTVKFEKGRHLDIYARLPKVRQHVADHYDRHPVITEVVPV